MSYKYTGKPFRMSPKTRALVVIAARNCAVSETEVVERCLDLAMRKAVTQAARAKSMRVAREIASMVQQAIAEIAPEDDRKLTPSCIRFQPEVTYILGAAARIGGFTETGILEKCIETEIVNATLHIYTEDSELRSEETAVAFAARLKAAGLDPTPYPRKTSYGSKSKRLTKSAQASELAASVLGKTSKVHELPGVGNIDKYVISRGTSRHQR